MWTALIYMTTFVMVCLAGLLAGLDQRTWDYELISVNYTSLDESKLTLSLNIERLGRGKFALSGEINWMYDVGDNTFIEYQSYRSSTGSNDYKLLPFSVPKQPFYDYINTIYHDVVMKNLAECTNLPQFDGKFVPPWPQKLYKFEHCEVNGDGMPPHLPEGFYKVVAVHSGPVEWRVELVAKLTKKIV